MSYDPTKWILIGFLGTPIAFLANNGCDSVWASIADVLLWWFACWVQYKLVQGDRAEAIRKQEEFLKDVKENGWKLKK